MPIVHWLIAGRSGPLKALVQDDVCDQEHGAPAERPRHLTRNATRPLWCGGVLKSDEK